MTPLKFFLFYLVLFSIETRADDFDASLKNVQTLSRRLDRRLSRLGLSPQIEAEENDTNLYGTSRKTQPLLVVHDSQGAIKIALGSYLFGRLETRLVVGGEPVPCIVKLEGDGSLSSQRIMGLARSGGTEGRVQIDFHSLLLSGGKSLKITSTALDKNGAYGIEAEVFSKKALAVAGSLAGSFVSGLALGSQTEETSAFGLSRTKVTPRNALLQGLAETGASESKRLIEESTKERPILVVEAGTEVTIFFSEELRF